MEFRDRPPEPRATHAPAIAGRAMPPWFASVPYHGMRPRTSRISVEPRRATHAAAAGPPRFIATITGAIETADHRSAGQHDRQRRSHQGNQRPERDAENDVDRAVPPSPIWGLGETARPVTTTADAARVTSPAIYSFRALGIQALTRVVYLGEL